MVCRYLGTPKLVRETSRRGFLGRSTASGGEKSAADVKKDFSDIVLPGGLHDHVRALAAVTANTRSHGAPFRHMLFYGPPGTALPLAAGFKESLIPCKWQVSESKRAAGKSWEGSLTSSL